MSSRTRPSNTGWSAAGTASVVRPAPARAAPSAASSAAPVLPREPPITSTWPNVPLWASRGRGGRRPATSRASRSVVAGATAAIAAGGMPMSTTSRTPVCSTPGCTTWPIFAQPNVAVTVARIAAPSGWPLSADSPEAMSTASTGRPDDADQRLTDSITDATRPVTGALRPVPRSASTVTAAFARRSPSAATRPAPVRSWTGLRPRRHAASMSAASPRTSAGCAASQTSTGTRARRR